MYTLLVLSTIVQAPLQGANGYIGRPSVSESRSNGCNGGGPPPGTLQASPDPNMAFPPDPFSAAPASYLAPGEGDGQLEDQLVLTRGGRRIILRVRRMNVVQQFPGYQQFPQFPGYQQFQAPAQLPGYQQFQAPYGAGPAPYGSVCPPGYRCVPIR